MTEPISTKRPLMIILALSLMIWPQAVFALQESDTNALVQEAMSLQKQGEWDQAIKKLDEAIQLTPKSPRLYVMRGMAQRHLNQVEQAFIDFGKAIEISPQAFLAYYNRATLFMDVGKLQEAIRDFDQYLTIKPGDAQVQFLRTIAVYKSGDEEQTRQSIKMILDVNPYFAEVYCLRGMLELKSNAHRAALHDFQRALKIKNDYPMAYYGKARALEKLGDTYGAAEYLSMACGLEPTFCDQETFMKTDEALLIVNSNSREPYRYCVCCLIHESEGRHVEDKVQALLSERRAKQMQKLKNVNAKTDFKFRDNYIESGIAFQHRCTEDSGRSWRPVHYDHGNGVSVADVDNDGIMDILFLTQVGGNELWRGLGNGKFEDMTERAGIGLDKVISVASAFGDYDRDGDPDLVITTVRSGNFVFENSGQGVFKNVTAESGINQDERHSSGVVFLDFDNDGWLDLFIVNVGSYTLENQLASGNYQGRKDAFAGHLHAERSEQSVLYRNLGNGKFADASKEMALQDNSWSGDASFVDLNNDRYPDLFLLNMQGDDRYYENQAGKSFRDRSAEYFSATPWGTMGAKFFDYDNNGKMDLYLTDMHSDMSIKVGPDKETLKSDMQWTDEFLQGGSNNIFGNAFYNNQGKTPLTEVSDEIGVENYWPWGLSVGDFNADGYQDILVAASMNYPWRYGINSLYINDGQGKFVDAEFALGIEPRSLTIKPWFTENCAAPNANPQICAQRNGMTVVWGALGSRSSALFDLDQDGDLDIVTNEFNSEPQILISDLSQKTKIRYLEIKLVGSKSNTDGLGAKVTLHAGKQTWDPILRRQIWLLKSVFVATLFRARKHRKIRPY